MLAGVGSGRGEVRWTENKRRESVSGKLLGGGRVSIKGRGRGGVGEDTRVVGVGHTGLPLKLLNAPVMSGRPWGGQEHVPGDLGVSHGCVLI